MKIIQKGPGQRYIDATEVKVHILNLSVRRHGLTGAKAVEELAGLGDRAVPHIVQEFTAEQDKMAKADLLWALTLVGDRSAEPAIREHGLTDSDLGVRQFSHWFLERVVGGKRPTVAEINARFGTEPPSMDHGRDLFPPLFAALELDMIGTEDTIPTLAVLSKTTGKYGQYVRGTVAWALRNNKTPAASKILTELMEDEDGEVR